MTPTLRNGCLRAGRGAARAPAVLVPLILAAWTILASAAAAQPGPPHFRRLPPEATLSEEILMGTLQAATVAWFFVLGAMVGSMLNVVAYRMPLGKSMWWPPSSCPACGARIQSRDNVPILGWIWLRGRCRACGVRISPRYPIVEAVCAGIFLVLACVELFRGGANLPVRPPDSYAGIVWNVWQIGGGTIYTYFYHCVLLSAELALALIAIDGNQPPIRRMVLPVAAFGVLAAAVRPALLPVPLVLHWDEPSWYLAAAQTLAGALLGVSLGAAVFGARSWGPACVLGLGGCYFGWQGIAGVAALGLVAALVSRGLLLVGVRIPVTTALAGALFAHLLLWREFAAVPWWPGPRLGPGGWLLWTLAAAGLAAAKFTFGKRFHANTLQQGVV